MGASNATVVARQMSAALLRRHESKLGYHVITRTHSLTLPPPSMRNQPPFSLWTAHRYALDDDMAAKLRKANPEAYQNILKRMLEAKGRGFWSPEDDVLERIQQQYADVEDDIELGTGGERGPPVGCRKVVGRFQLSPYIYIFFP